MHLFRSGVSKILLLLNKSVKKNRKIILFNSFPDMSDSSLALFEYIAKNEQQFMNEYKLIWLIDKGDMKRYRENLINRTGCSEVRVIRKSSAKGVFFFLCSSIIISTHGCFSSLIVPDQINFNLWHGMPFKKIGALLRGNENARDKADITVATSPLFQEIMALSFNISKDNVYVTGYPRNDYLFSDKDYLKKFDIKRSDFNKIIFWLPTYRKSVVGDVRLDGEERAFGVRDIFEKYFVEVEKILKENKYMLIIKPHPMDVLSLNSYDSSDNIKFIKNEELANKNIQLYELLSNSDSLITDYSSVFIDYMSTGKPIAFIADDLDAYASTRGFVFDPPTEYLPGQIIHDINEFLSYLKNYDKCNLKWADKYESIRKLFNTIRTADSSKLVYELLAETINKQI